MIKKITPLTHNGTFCEVCRKKCKGIRKGYLLTSTEKKDGKAQEMVLCNCCIDIALNDCAILPDEF